MRMCIINGRRIAYPDAATPEEIAAGAGLPPNRRIVYQTREGNYPMNPGERVDLNDGDRFVDAPQRVKGIHSFAFRETK